MEKVILTMLEQYVIQNDDDYENALKQIMQEIALLGLWRSKFFEHAAFYGGTALRILYGLDRFSEDLDFSLLYQNQDFDLGSYLNAIQAELEAFGFETSVSIKEKNVETAIISAFLKANTQEHLIKVNAPQNIVKQAHGRSLIKIKLEVDTMPPLEFNTESRPLLNPIPFWVKSFCLPDLFAGKLSAVICRQWQNRVKGRDWYDFLWFIQRKTPVNLQHLKARLMAFDFDIGKTPLTLQSLKEILHSKVKQLDIELAKSDIIKFISNPNILDAWSHELFHDIVERISSE